MRVPSKALYTARSSVVVVVLLVGTYILCHSYNWQLLPDNWSHLDLPSFASPQSEADKSKVPIRSEISDENDGTVEKLNSPYGSSTKAGESSQLQQKGPKQSGSDDVGPLGGESDFHWTPSNGAAVIERVDLNLEVKSNGRFKEYDLANEETLSAVEDRFVLTPGKDRGNTTFGAPDQRNWTAPPWESKGAHFNDTSVAPHLETSESIEAAESSKAEGVAETPFEAINSVVTAETSKQLVLQFLPFSGQLLLKKKSRQSYDELSSLQKVELDLRQARAAMKKVATAQLNSGNDGFIDESLSDGEPSGVVYRNAAVFRQSYREMERRFRVYAYSEGEKPLVHDGPCKEIYSVEGRFIQELQGDNPLLTFDPEAAHVFFLPFSVAMMVTYLYTANSGDMSPLLRFVKDYVQVVKHKYPFWNRSNGADHFMVSCHDWAPYLSRADGNLASKAIRVLCNANVSEGYNPTKDASLPEIHLVGGEIPAELGGLPANQRTLLAFFAGGDHGPVRPALFHSWEGKEGNIRVYHEVPKDGKSYHDYMKTSQYCLCPGGYEVNSPRIVEAIYNDCVPVVIADNFVLPFSDVLDWNKFSVRVSEIDIPNLRTILEGIPMETYIRMQGRLKLVRHHFLLNQPPKRYDVFNMILHSVWLRRLNIRIRE